ncbi:uncharacterized protein [Anabrus simplex]|uniref:uncharacterized protein n=1 Tax=Anabrus simplex TaxID=316456 RepID=UPI0035A37B8D
MDECNMRHVYDDHVNTDMTFPDFKKICAMCWDNSRQGFIVIDKDRPRNEGRYPKSKTPQFLRTTVLAETPTRQSDLSALTSTPEFKSYLKETYGELAAKYVKRLFMGRTDRTYGVRYENDLFYIGNTEVTLDSKTIVVKRVRYALSEGLLELLFSYIPNSEVYTDSDLEKYKSILRATNAYRRNYDSSAAVNANKSYKYREVISKLFPTQQNIRHLSASGLRTKMWMPRVDYTYWNDPNKLVERLLLLDASRSAGHTGHEGIARELHKTARRHYRRRRVITRGKDDLWQADLVEMIPYATSNSGIKYLLTVIVVYSKFAFAEPVRAKTASVVTAAFKAIIKRAGRYPRLLQTDQGREFYNKEFSTYLNSLNIHHYSTYSNLKASVVERFNRTLKTIMWREFTARGSYRWLDILQNIVDRYNNTVHRTTEMKPRDVRDNRLLKTVYSRVKIADRKRHRFKTDDFVRISKHKSLFDKGYTPNWSTEIFQIDKVQLTNPATYVLRDLAGQPIKGGFYAEELQKTQYPNSYLVEKVLRKRGNKLYVKWLGFNNTFNSWINKSDVL